MSGGSIGGSICIVCWREDMEGGQAAASLLYRSGSVKMELDLEDQREILRFTVSVVVFLAEIAWYF